MKELLKTVIEDNHLYSLVVELTRNCNFKCSHCLRGEAQKFNLNIYDLRMFLYENNIKSITTLTLTGGEPLMYPELISTLAQDIIMMGIEIDNVYIATNGSYFNKESFEALKKLYFTISDSLTLEVSNSVYHQEERKKLGINLLIYKEEILEKLKEKEMENILEYENEEDLDYMINNNLMNVYDLFNQENFYIELDSRSYKSLISEGRGSAIGGKKEVIEQENMIYFSAKSEVVLNKCDLSFKSIRQKRIK